MQIARLCVPSHEDGNGFGADTGSCGNDACGRLHFPKIEPAVIMTGQTGVRGGEVSYVASQARPFPSGLMIGFRATAITKDITVDGEELLEARWFTRPELVQYAADNPLGRPDSIDRHLLRTWLAEGDELEPDAAGNTKMQM